MTPQRPAVVTGATWLAAAAVAMTGLTALMTVVFKDELVRAWAADRSDAGAGAPPPLARGSGGAAGVRAGGDHDVRGGRAARHGADLLLPRPAQLGPDPAQR